MCCCFFVEQNTKCDSKFSNIGFACFIWFFFISCFDRIWIFSFNAYKHGDINFLIMLTFFGILKSNFPANKELKIHLQCIQINSIQNERKKS